MVARVHILLLFLSITAAAFLSANQAEAQTLNVDIEAIISAVDSNLESHFDAGAPFHFSAKIDQSAPDSNPYDPDIGVYGAIQSYNIAAGDFFVAESLQHPNNIVAGRNLTAANDRDEFVLITNARFSTVNSPLPPGVFFMSFNFSANGPSSAFSSVDLGTLLNPALFNQINGLADRSAALQFGNGVATFEVELSQLQIEISTIPEPEHYAAILGALALGFIVRRERRKIQTRGSFESLIP